LNAAKTFDEADLTETAHDTARNSANCYKAGNDENNSNDKVEIFSGRIVFFLVSFFFTLAFVVANRRAKIKAVIFIFD
jgi:hypothetical protein